MGIDPGGDHGGILPQEDPEQEHGPQGHAQCVVAHPAGLGQRGEHPAAGPGQRAGQVHPSAVDEDDVEGLPEAVAAPSGPGRGCRPPPPRPRRYLLAQSPVQDREAPGEGLLGGRVPGGRCGTSQDPRPAPRRWRAAMRTQARAAPRVLRHRAITGRPKVRAGSSQPSMAKLPPQILGSAEQARQQGARGQDRQGQRSWCGAFMGVVEGVGVPGLAPEGQRHQPPHVEGGAGAPPSRPMA